MLTRGARQPVRLTRWFDWLFAQTFARVSPGTTLVPVKKGERDGVQVPPGLAPGF